MGQRPRGPLDSFEPTQPLPKAVLADVIEAYNEHYANDTLPRSGRGIFYDLRPYGRGNGVTYTKDTKDYPVTVMVWNEKLGRMKRERNFGPMEVHPAYVGDSILLSARRAGIIPESWVADARAPDSMGNHFDDNVEDTADSIASMVRDAAEDFDLNPQRFQPVHIEILCEAADLAPRLARIAGDQGVRVYSGGGFDGLKGKREFANRALRRDKPTIVLQVGDRDLHGGNIYVAAAEDAYAWARDKGAGGGVMPLDWYEKPEDLTGLMDELHGQPAIVFVRLALTIPQAKKLDLLDTDGKAEVDGVPVAVMDGWITDAIDALQDPKAQKRHEDDLAEQRGRMPELMRTAMADFLNE